MNDNMKKLAIDVDTATHTMVKKIATEKCMTIKMWLSEAIYEKISRDADLGFKIDLRK